MISKAGGNLSNCGSCFDIYVGTANRRGNGGAPRSDNLLSSNQKLLGGEHPDLPTSISKRRGDAGGPDQNVCPFDRRNQPPTAGRVGGQMMFKSGPRP